MVRKYNKLKSYYIQLRKKSDGSRIQWPYYQSFAFLDPFLKEHPESQSNANAGALAAVTDEASDGVTGRGTADEFDEGASTSAGKGSTAKSPTRVTVEAIGESSSGLSVHSTSDAGVTIEVTAEIHSEVQNFEQNEKL